jgi:sugar phosphate isomerase/epimerase
MVLTVHVQCLAPLLKPAKGGKAALTLWELPRFAHETLQVNGLAMSTGMLAGLDRAGLQQFVEAADRAGCPCLTLIESDPQPLFDEDRAPAAADRVLRVIQAANWLGCSSVGIALECPDNDEALQETADNLKPLVRKAERLELNLCISSGKGLTSTPERVGELLKRVGGFRIGTLPDLLSASKSADPSAYLRKLVPYASHILAVSSDFGPAGKKGKHEPYDLGEYLKIIGAVGFDGGVAIDYRGGGDLVEGLIACRDALRPLVGEAPHEEEL